MRRCGLSTLLAQPPQVRIRRPKGGDANATSRGRHIPPFLFALPRRMAYVQRYVSSRKEGTCCMMYSPRLVLSIERFPKEYTRLDRARSILLATTSYSSSAAYYCALPLAIFNFQEAMQQWGRITSHTVPGGQGDHGLKGSTAQFSSHMCLRQGFLLDAMYVALSSAQCVPREFGWLILFFLFWPVQSGLACDTMSHVSSNG